MADCHATDTETKLSPSVSNTHFHTHTLDCLQMRCLIQLCSARLILNRFTINVTSGGGTKGFSLINDFTVKIGLHAACRSLICRERSVETTAANPNEFCSDGSRVPESLIRRINSGKNPCSDRLWEDWLAAERIERPRNTKARWRGWGRWRIRSCARFRREPNAALHSEGQSVFHFSVHLKKQIWPDLFVLDVRKQRFLQRNIWLDFRWMLGERKHLRKLNLAPLESWNKKH